MGKRDPMKPRDKMSLYAFFVQTCSEEHKKKYPDASVNFSEISKKCSEGWKTISAKEKGKFEEMAKVDKAHYKREAKTYIPPKGKTKRKLQDPNVTKMPPSAFCLFVLIGVLPKSQRRASRPIHWGHFKESGRDVE